MDASFFDREDLRPAVVGGGSWAIALVRLLQYKVFSVHWYLRDPDAVDFIRKHGHHPRYLQAVSLDPGHLSMHTDPNEVLAAADVALMAVPSAYFPQTMEQVSVPLENKFFISAVKGFVTESCLTVAEYFHRLRGIPYDRIGVLSGPSHAEEMGMQRLSYLTLTAKHRGVAERLCDLFRADYVRTVAATDIYGVEYAAALKNVYAIAAGMAHGLGYGDNFMAVLTASAYRELLNFLDRTYPDANRNTGLSAYLGDLLVTCYSQFSRNRTFGSLVGKGYAVVAARAEMNMVVEGYYAVRAIREINSRYGVPMPIADAVYAVLYDGADAVRTFRELTCRLK